jgi:hypothetical protein
LVWCGAQWPGWSRLIRFQWLFWYWYNDSCCWRGENHILSSSQIVSVTLGTNEHVWLMALINTLSALS